MSTKQHGHAKTGLAVGYGKGFITTKFEEVPRNAGVRKLSKRVTMIRSVVREVAGFAPYEKRIMELVKGNAPKRALKYAKRRLGTHSRGKAKRNEMTEIIMKAREKN